MVDSTLETRFSGGVQFFPRARVWLQAVRLSFAQIETSAASPTAKSIEDELCWTTVHHQILTLAERSSRDPRLNVLWFRAQSANGDDLFGAGLPDGRVALLEPRSKVVDATAMKSIRGKLAPTAVVGSRAIVEKAIEIIGPEWQFRQRQTAWRHPLLNDAPLPDLFCRRAKESDRPVVEGFARQFAIEHSQSVVNTLLEAKEWMRRGRLFIFATNCAENEAEDVVAMAALTGEWHSIELMAYQEMSIRLSLLLVDPRRRGEGFGRRAVRAIEYHACQEAPATTSMVLFANDDEPRAAMFYSSLGYSFCGEWFEVGRSVNTTG